ncbi:hypothetical protein A2924_01425 [Candidatus Giovannonibacteria bacterium RIFCSPLOWO2_01_FULL_44_16]|uniref:Uncharacterized protein n=1 Tax=Candidatus Giovannonibacteria bacterium RIFCSPLOWO2_01_FULL_44_16 TaxID=1798348 RepID=A0A1F5X4M6_9BACT|nr:MAG: hypothetical protein A2924_01425 [Candidatus Giovannonibacteria bacterium RIFCSPLOWO2_01_FULL_44_16]
MPIRFNESGILDFLSKKINSKSGLLVCSSAASRGFRTGCFKSMLIFGVKEILDKNIIGVIRFLMERKII